MLVPFDYEAFDRWQHVWSFLAPLYYAAVPLTALAVGKARSIAFKLDKLTWIMAAFMFPAIWVLDYLDSLYRLAFYDSVHLIRLMLMLGFAALLARPAVIKAEPNYKKAAFAFACRCIAAFALIWFLYEAQLALQLGRFEYWFMAPLMK